MNDTPTRGPISRRKTHHARETTSSRHSLSSSHKNADLRESKKHLFEVRVRNQMTACFRERRKLRESAFTTYLASAQEHEAITDAGSIGNLVDRQEHGSLFVTGVGA